MAEIVGLLLPLGFLVGVYWFIFRGASGTAKLPRSGGYSLGSVVLLEGLVAAMALAQVAVVTSALDGPVAAGALLGVVTGLAMRLTFLGAVTSWGYSVLGILASLPSIATLVTSDSPCFAVDRGQRIVLAGAMIAIFLVTSLFGAAGRLFGAAGLAVRRSFASLGLGWYALVEYTTFLATAAGMDVIGSGTAVAFTGVVVVAAITPFWPQLVTWTIGAGLALVTLAGASVFGPNGPLATQCLAVDLSFPTLVGYLIAVFFTWLIVSRFK